MHEQCNRPVGDILWLLSVFKHCHFCKVKGIWFTKVWQWFYFFKLEGQSQVNWLTPKLAVYFHVVSSYFTITLYYCKSTVSNFWLGLGHHSLIRMWHLGLPFPRCLGIRPWTVLLYVGPVFTRRLSSENVSKWTAKPTTSEQTSPLNGRSRKSSSLRKSRFPKGMTLTWTRRMIFLCDVWCVCIEWCIFCGYRQREVWVCPADLAVRDISFLIPSSAKTRLFTKSSSQTVLPQPPILVILQLAGIVHPSISYLRH